MNITVVPHSTLDYLTAGEGGPQPEVSTLNAPTGAITANAAVVPALNGMISIYASDSTDVIMDVNSYFQAEPPFAAGGSLFYPSTPCRVMDTRNGSGAFTGVLAVNVLNSACAPPATAQAYVLNATVVPSGPLNYLTLWPDGEAQPLVSTLNAEDGAIASNMAIVPTNNGIIDAYTTDATNLIVDYYGYFQ